MTDLLRRRRPDIRKLARRQDVEALVRALGYRDYLVDHLGRMYDLGASVRRDASLALGEVASTGAVDVDAALIAALGDRACEVRCAAARALASRGVRRAVPALVNATLTWTNPRYATARAAALEALANLEGPDTTETLVISMVQGNQDLKSAWAVLARIVAEGNGDGRRPAIAAASRALCRSDREGAERAAEVLVWLGPASLQALIEALAQPTARPFAIQSLGRLRDLRATETLVGLLADHDAQTRRAAASALGDTSDPRATGPLLAATEDPDYGVRVAALRAAQKLGPPRLPSEKANENGPAHGSAPPVTLDP